MMMNELVQRGAHMLDTTPAVLHQNRPLHLVWLMRVVNGIRMERVGCRQNLIQFLIRDTSLRKLCQDSFIIRNV